MDIQEIKHWIATNRIHDMYQDSEVKSLLNWSVDEIAQLRRERDSVLAWQRGAVEDLVAERKRADGLQKELKCAHERAMDYSDIGKNWFEKWEYEEKRADMNERALGLASNYIDTHVDTIQRLKDAPCPDYFRKLAESK